MAEWTEDFIVIPKDSKSEKTSVVDESSENITDKNERVNKLAIEIAEEGDDFYNVEFCEINKVCFGDIGSVGSVDKLNIEVHEQLKERKKSTKEIMENDLNIIKEKSLENFKYDISKKKKSGRYSGYCFSPCFFKWLK